MEKLIIQQVSRHGSLFEFIKSTGETIALGRGFNNDVILSDHFIAPNQLRFDYEAGQWTLKLLDFTNSVLVNGKPVSDGSVIIQSGDKLTVGRTHLILLLSNSPVERTRKLVLSNWSSNRKYRFTLPFVMLLVSAFVAVFSDYLELTGKIHWGQLVSGGLGYVLFITLWASSWALVGRVLRHRPNFFEQLFYTALMGTALSAGKLFYGYAGYASTYEYFGAVIESGFVLLVLGILLKYNLSYATAIKNRGKISFSVIGLLMLFSFLIQHLGQGDFNTQAEYSKTLKPPFAKLSADKSIDVFLLDVDGQFNQLEKVMKSNGTN